MYFKSDIPCYAEYSAHVDNPEIDDFTRILNNKEKNNITKTHEYTLIGLVPDEVNEITIRLYNKNNEFFAAKTFKTEPLRVSEYADMTLKKEKGESSEMLSDGLFVTMGHINGKDTNSYYYDNNGYMRGEIKLDGYRIDRMR